MVPLDYSLQTPEERVKYLNAVLATFSSLELAEITKKEAERLSDYIIFAADKQERKQKKILTENRLLTIRKRETSYEGLCSKLEGGENDITHLVNPLGKTAYLSRKPTITYDRIDSTPDLKSLNDAIDKTQLAFVAATGKKKFLLKKQIIQMQQDKYILDQALNGGGWKKGSKYISEIAKTDFYDDYCFDYNDEPYNDGVISFFKPSHILALLTNYSDLKAECEGEFRNDLWYLMQDLDNLIEKTLKADYPIFYQVLIFRIDGLDNAAVAEKVYDECGVKLTSARISVIWRQRIPKLLTEQAKKDYVEWYYKNKYHSLKHCSCCRRDLPKHQYFFSRNSYAKDGWYCWCKDCRNAKNKERRAAKK